ncbi:uncharacterized protein LOC141622683 [Silene latifolia]|uniref:uncharacterized protein LOC141622683 n=1 Tax=Silene latifolia TaxID=37657 RepID=UPI003D776864
MASQISFSPHMIIVQQSDHLKKSVFGMSIFRKNQLPVKKAAKLQIRSSIRHQVFEDHATGVICYKDDSGEIICEGLDEGPRLLQPRPATQYPYRDGDMVDRLQQRWLQIIDGQSTSRAFFMGLIHYYIDLNQKL